MNGKMLILLFFLFQINISRVIYPTDYNTFVPPNVLDSYKDPNFHTTIKRITDAINTHNATDDDNLSWIENEYSTINSFNCDSSEFILIHESYFGLYDISGTFLGNLPMEINSSSEPRWSKTNNALIYYHYGNQFRTYNLLSKMISTLHTFTQFTTVNGTGESDISKDGNHFVFVGDNQNIFVYQLDNDHIYDIWHTDEPLDSVYITPDNNVLVSWIQSGTTRYTGEELFDINMNFLRQIAHSDGHKDITRDINGNEVLIWENSNDPFPIPNCQNGIVRIRLYDGLQTCLLQLDWSLAVHISAPDNNDMVYIDTESPSNPEPGEYWAKYTNEILCLSLDGKRIAHIAFHRSRPINSYNWQPKVSCNNDGTKLLFSSNFDLNVIENYPKEYSDTYLINFRM
jgi:hypothetical protein